MGLSKRDKQHYVLDIHPTVSHSQETDRHIHTHTLGVKGKEMEGGK